MPGWRWLGVFWAVVALGAAGTVWRLHQLGPPEAPAPAPGEAPAPQVGPAPATPEPPAPAQAVTAPAPPAAEARSAPMPAAPEPPPLAAAPAPASAAGRPIPAPDPALLETGRHGALPRIGADGRTSIRAYAREFDRRDTRPRIGIIVSDIGLSATQTDDAIRRLPPAVALALSPYAVRPGQAAERARERGMETLIAIPMEPAGYPTNDPGDRALLTGRPMAENLDLLDWSLSRAQGYVGAIGAIGGMRGERFAALPDAVGAVQDVLFRRGVLYVDPRPGAASPARAWGRSVDLVLDEPGGTRGEIDRRLAELEGLARERGAALGLSGSASPVVVERIAAWAQGLDARGLVLAPVSAMIRRPEGSASDSNPLRPASAP
ncbi:divergent polysaccharide deacetylase family protein [Neoroseomonas oryzicola]|uniref:Divergent polysaccharide deacetylase family protein n=3 Tax=Neoroseomonas oryzicola TaxID=535904 RepID=A0ABX1EHI1_9PROT|nr:divergent polysaccharide deacetylase family protein [Neoroseomonas oryzicola]